MIIVGAGLAGLMAAHAWPSALVFEAADGPGQMHHALLRFRTDAVARLTGTEFKQVTVRKGIWHEGTFRSPDPRLANMYAQKCLGLVRGDRSIWDIEPVKRYVAPENFYEQLIRSAGSRIRWGSAFDYRKVSGDPIISTAPLPLVLEQLGWLAKEGVTFDRAPILVERFHLDGWEDVYQTVYFPDPNHSMYRASITGSMLIVEHAGERVFDLELARSELCEALFLSEEEMKPLSKVKQSFGKIAPVTDDQARKNLVYRLSLHSGIFSLGRFATWRNILLDDVVNDIAVIKRLMRGAHYERALAV